MHKLTQTTPTIILDCHRQSIKFPKIPQFGPMFWDRSYGPFSAFFISIHVLNHKFLELKHPNSPLNFWAVTATKEILKKIPTIRSHVLGPIKRPLTASNQPKHRKTLKMRIKLKYGENPTSWSCQKLANPGSTRSLLRVERFPFLLRRNPTVRSRVFLERSQRLSLYK